jgi:hypothetical protein
MTKSIRAQKLFLRLSTNQRKRWMRMPGSRRRRRSWGKVFPVPNRVKVEIINAVTGEKTTAYAAEDSKRALKKWLRVRNIRAQFEDMVLKPHASWSNFTTVEWENFPIIVRVGDAQFPYLISHVGERIATKNKVMCSIFLVTADNIDYLSIVNQKKKLMKDWIEKHPIKAKKKAKRKKRRFNFDDE